MRATARSRSLRLPYVCVHYLSNYADDRDRYVIGDCAHRLNSQPSPAVPGADMFDAFDHLSNIHSNRKTASERKMDLAAPVKTDVVSHDDHIYHLENIATKCHNHSNDNLDEIQETTDYVDSFSIPYKGRISECHHEYLERPCPHTIERDELHNKDDVFGKESISVRKEEEVDLYGGRRKARYLKFKCRLGARDWSEVLAKTRRFEVRAVAVFSLLLMMLASCTAAPSNARSTRNVDDSKSTRSYLEQFGYLKKGQLEIANLLHGDAAQWYEDDFRIAIKTLQEFGGIPVTGEVDEATKELMQRRRCGQPDRDIEEGIRKKRFAMQGAKWLHTNLTWSLSSRRRPSALDPHYTRAVLNRALKVWEQASRLTFTEVNSDDADIVVSFAKRYHGDSYPFDGRGAILAHAFFPGTGNGGDAHFDDEELWLLEPTNDDEEGTSLFAVAVHEFGHSLGLSHSSVKGALMYPWYQGIQPNFVLPEDDRNGIQQMYGPKEKRVWGRIPYYQPVETPPTTTSTTTTRRPFHNDRHRHPTRHPNQPGYNPHRPERRHNTTDERNRRPTHRYPRPTPETTTPSTTYRPRYPQFSPDYPSRPRPNNPKQDYPKKDYPKKTYYPEKTTTRPSTTPSDKPDTCDTSYDAVALIRGELFIFKNRYHWRMGAHGRYSGYPMEITKMWSGLPKNLTHVDAVYERPDGKIAFFIGKEIFLFDTQYLLRGYPKPLIHLGLPESLEKLDAVMVWGHNGKTYFYSGSMYWKFDEEEGRVELDYPRDMSMWNGVGYNIDSVFQWKDGKTYFFKGKGYWKFNDLKMQVEHERQQPSAPKWMGCPTERIGRREPYRSFPAPGSTLRSPSAANNLYIHHALPWLTSALLLVISYVRYS